MFSSTPVLQIDKSVIRENYLNLEKLAHSSKIAAVVKADCYGLGADVLPPFYEELGCREFFVACVEEGIRLRHALSNGDSKIFILNGVFTDTAPILHEHSLIPVINDLDQLALWQGFARSKSCILPVVIHIDTGLNRLGIGPSEISGLEQFEGLEIELLMSHFASSDIEDSKQNDGQIRLFEEISARLPGLRRSICNSAGIFHQNPKHYDMVRPGAALCGLITHPEATKYINNPISLQAPIIAMRELSPGQQVGYNATFEATDNMRIATLPIGYADGYMRIHSNQGLMYLDNKPVKVLGRVSMDLTVIDVSDIDPAKLSPGTMVEIFGLNQTPSDLAAMVDTVPQEIITSLGKRLERKYN